MKIKIAFIAILSLLLVSGPVLVATSATITPKSLNGNTILIKIEEGDTLWELANKYLEDPGLWKEFKKYNDFTDPNLIFPGEKLRVPKSFAMPAQSVITAVEQKELLSKKEIETIKSQLEKAKNERAGNQKQIIDLESKVSRLETQSKELREELMSTVAELESANELGTQALDKLGKRLKRIYKGTEKETEQFDDKLSDIKDQLNRSEKIVSDLTNSNNSVVGEIESAKEQIAHLNGKIQTIEEQNTAALALAATSEVFETTEQLISQREEGTISDAEFLVSLSENGLDTDEKLEELHEQGIISKEELTTKKAEGKKKRTTILITAVAGGIAWLAVSVLGN